MKPSPGDTSHIWRAGTCLGKVAPRSYLVDIEGLIYRRNRIDLRVAESGAAPGSDELVPHSHTEESGTETIPTVIKVCLPLPHL